MWREVWGRGQRSGRSLTGIGISVMKDHRTGPYLVPVWDKRGGEKGDLSRSSSIVPQEERG